MSFTQWRKIGGMRWKAWGGRLAGKLSPARPQKGRWGDGNWMNKEPLQSSEETPGWGTSMNGNMEQGTVDYRET